MRSERDSLGEREVPARALYGIHSLRAVENLAFSGRSLGQYPAYVRALATVKKAAARANRIAGVLEPQLAAAVETACDEIFAGRHLDQLIVDPLGGGGGIGVNMNVNEVIANLANESLGGERGVYEPVHPKLHVNASQSTADVCATASRLAVLEHGRTLERALAGLGDALVEKTAALRPVQTMARTCLRDALPCSLGDLFSGYASGVERRAQQLSAATGELRRINLGGTVIGSGGGAPPVYRAAVLQQLEALVGEGLERRADLYDAAQNIDDLAAVSSQLALLAEVLIKLGQDLRLLSSGPEGGFGEIALPHVQEGSSFFAGKSNPVVPETLIDCCIQVLACDHAVQLALQRGELNLNVFEAVAAINLLEGMEMLSRGVTLFIERCLRGVQANSERCAELARYAVRNLPPSETT